MEVESVDATELFSMFRNGMAITRLFHNGKVVVVQSQLNTGFTTEIKFIIVLTKVDHLSSFDMLAMSSFTGQSHHSEPRM